MSTSIEFMEYVGGQFSEVSEISWKKMFGEYGVYSRGKFFALVCDNQLFVKPTEAGRLVLGEPEMAPPYTGAKPHFLVSELEDRDLLTELAEKTCSELPEPKQKKPKAKKGVD